DILQRERMVENAAEVGEHIATRLAELELRHEAVIGVRSLGMLAAFDLDGEQLVGPSDAGRAGQILMADLTAAGVLVRPYGNTMAFGPALPTSREEIDLLFDHFDAAVRRVMR